MPSCQLLRKIFKDKNIEYGKICDIMYLWKLLKTYAESAQPESFMYPPFIIMSLYIPTVE